MEPSSAELDAMVKKRNLQYFIKWMVYSVIATVLLSALASWLVMTVPADADWIVVYWIIGFAVFILVGILISRIVGFKKFIVRHGIIVENTLEIQQVLEEEKQERDTIKPTPGKICQKCGSDVVFTDEENAGVCGKCGVGMHTV